MDICSRTILILLLCFGSVGAWTQIIYTASFTHALRQAGIEYAEPVEQWLHVTIPPDDEFMEYDLVLQNDRNDFEVRYHFADENSAIPASIAVSRLVASIAVNDEAQNIVVRIPPEEFLKDAFNADRGVLVQFTPKETFSEKRHGAFLSLYADGRPSVNVVLLYMDQSFDPLTMYRSVRYRD